MQEQQKLSLASERLGLHSYQAKVSHRIVAKVCGTARARYYREVLQPSTP